nr:MAG TPA: hypothetical protein [Caudoviricetes sp.]
MSKTIKKLFFIILFKQFVKNICIITVTKSICILSKKLYSLLFVFHIYLLLYIWIQRLFFKPIYLIYVFKYM